MVNPGQKGAEGVIGVQHLRQGAGEGLCGFTQRLALHPGDGRGVATIGQRDQKRAIQRGQGGRDG